MAETNLSEVSAGTDLLINKIKASTETCMRLNELGLTENSTVRVVVSNPSQLICEVFNTRIGLHRKVAKNIIVKYKN
jgi:Fe2+ transport system protein FeoA